MKTNLNKVYKNMPKKTNLATRKIDLKLMQDIEIVIGTGFDIKDDASILIDDAKAEYNAKISQARELLDFELPDAINQAQELINDAISKLDDLGVEAPSDLMVYMEKLDELRDIRTTLEIETF